MLLILFTSFSTKKFLVTLSLMAFNVASKYTLVIKLLTSGISVSTAVNTKLAAKPLISGILLSTTVEADFLTKSLTPRIFLSILLI